MKRLIFTSMFLIAGATAVLAAAPAVETSTLRNGLRVVLAPDSDARAADVALWFDTGSRVEPPGRSGITHVIERLLFRAGDTRAGDYRRRIQAEGGVANTYTTPDFTSLYATVPPAAIDLALQLDAERLAGLHFTAADLEAERSFVIRERRVSLGTNPLGRALERLYALAFPGNGYGRPVIGSEDDLTRITLGDAQAYARDRYAPGNAVLTVVGRFDPKSTLAAIRTRFEGLPKRGTPPAPPAPPPPAGRRATDRAALRSPMVLMGWRAPAAADPGNASLELLARVLGSGNQGRLSRDLSSNPVFSQARAGFDPREDGSLFYALALVRTKSDSVVAEASLARAVELLASDPVTSDELDRVKKEWELDWLTEQQTVRGQARALGTSLLIDHDAQAARRRQDAIRNLTVADLQAAASHVLTSQARCVVWMLPAGSARPSSATGGDAR